MFVAAAGTSGGRRNYDIAPDGQHLIIVFSSNLDRATEAPPQVNVVLNWFEELEARVPVR